MDIFTEHISVSVEHLSETLLQNLTEQKVGVELSFFAKPDNLEPGKLKEKIVEYKSLLSGFSGKVSMHGSFTDLNPTTRDPKLLEVCNFRIRESLEIASELTLAKIVFHPNFFPSTRSEYKEYWIEKQIRFWEKHLHLLQSEGITMYLENTREEDFSYILPIVKALNSPFVKICYDTGHSNCFTVFKVPPAEWVKAYGDYLGYIHLHSNHGFTDDHIAFTKGNVNFGGFFEAVNALINSPEMIIEVKSSEEYELSLQALRKRNLQ